MTQPVNLWISIRFGQLEVNMSADDVSSYAPDVMDDLAKQSIRAFTEAITELRSHGVIGILSDDPADDEDDDDDDEGEDTTE